MIELAAYILMCAIGAGVVYGALEWIVKDIIFERIGKKRRRRNREEPLPVLRLNGGKGDR